MKKKFLSLGLAVMLLMGVTGCAFKTPASVGSIGGVEIPAGVYLLMQYNAYGTASSAAELATGETAQNVDAVLKAQCTGTIVGEEVTATGKEYVAQLTRRSMEYYAAVESKFEELGGVLDDAATAEAASTADSLWDSNGELYAANGIGKQSVENYLLNSQKARAIEQLLYGENGVEPVTEQDYADYISNECYYVDLVMLPLYDSSSYVFATEDQAARIDALADECVQTLTGLCTPETASGDAYQSLYTAASEYLPQVFETLGVSTYDASTAYYYTGSQLLLPSDLTYYDDGEGGNAMTDVLDALSYGQWGKVDLGTSIAVLRKVDPLKEYTAAELADSYGLLDEIKSEEVQAMLYDLGASMEHSLSDSAMKTYAASKIKRTV